MELHRFKVPWAEATLIPLGDIQLQPNEDAVDLKKLKETVKWGVANNAYWIGMGDFIDLESPSNRRAIAHSGVYDSVTDALDAHAEELEEQLMDILRPTVGRWLGVLEGHHYHPHQTGQTTDTKFAEFLRCPFLGTSAYVGLEFAAKSTHRSSVIVDIWAHHGRGGGQSAGGPTNVIERMVAGFQADIMLMGHTHTLGYVPRSRVRAMWGTKNGYLHDQTVHLVNTGSYLKGFQERSQRNGRPAGGYAEQGMMRPLALGSPKIHFKPVTTHGEARVDVSVEI